MINKNIMIFFILFIIIILYYHHTIHINDKRHLTNSYNYAHFSKINLENFLLSPSLLLTKPIRIVLNEGESVYIPKKWWHWVITHKKTSAINFWFESDVNSNIFEPYKIKNLYTEDQSNEIYDNINESIKEDNFNIWNSDINDNNNNNIQSGKNFLNENIKNKYLITLDGYGFTNNNNFKNKIKKFIKIPKFLDTNPTVDFNIWFSSDYHDTGLHYDDNDGILHVFKGEKHITFFPPEDSKYLLPYDLIPNYAKESAIYMNYNAHSIINESINGLSSQMLLYQTLLHFAVSKNIYKIIQEIYDLKMSNKLIWGFKKEGNKYRWEIYNYHYDVFNNQVKTKKYWQQIILNKSSITSNIVEYINNENTIINSIDILNNHICLNNEHHTYEILNYKLHSKIQLPVNGIGYDIINDEKIKVGHYIYDTYENFFKNQELYFKQLDLPYNSQIGNILNKYKSNEICLWNKKGDYFIQWLMISVDDFIHFLKDNNYDENFIKYVIDNREKYINISHEITIVFDRNNLIPYRSGFYGCL